MSDWTYKGEPYLAPDVDVIGFVYCITNKTNGKKYIGKKNFYSKRSLPPLKGKTRKRRKIVESDWKTYYGSSEEVKNILLTEGDIFDREIIHLCKSKGDMSYAEAYYQLKYHVLLKPDEFYNKFIGLKLHANHLKDLNPDSFEDFD